MIVRLYYITGFILLATLARLSMTMPWLAWLIIFSMTSITSYGIHMFRSYRDEKRRAFRKIESELNKLRTIITDTIAEPPVSHRPIVIQIFDTDQQYVIVKNRQDNHKYPLFDTALRPLHTANFDAMRHGATQSPLHIGTHLVFPPQLINLN